MFFFLELSNFFCVYRLALFNQKQKCSFLFAAWSEFSLHLLMAFAEKLLSVNCSRPRFFQQTTMWERKRTLFAYHSSKLSNFTHLLCKSNQMKLEKIVYFSLLVDSSSIENHMKFRFQRGAIPPFYIRSYSALRTSKFLKGNSRVL